MPILPTGIFTEPANVDPDTLARILAAKRRG